MLIAFGHGETQGAPHKNKPLQAVCNRTENMPEWFLNGMEAALLAPTAMNQQKFFFELFSDSKVNAVCGKGFYTKLDLGIVKYHFEIASGRKPAIMSQQNCCPTGNKNVCFSGCMLISQIKKKSLTAVLKY